MLPWNNSWFQLSAATAIFSGCILGWDFKGGRFPSTGTSTYSSTPSYTQNATNSVYPTPTPAPFIPPQEDTTPTPAPTTSGGSFPRDGTEFYNSLGMQFESAGTAGVLVCARDTRVQDFREFVKATGYDATADVYSLDEKGWSKSGRNWYNPGFYQGETYPVVAVSWYDAEKFCEWLTQKERQAGVIAPNQYYRLPHDAEWTAAAGGTTYPWGDAWPPAETAGNYIRHGDAIPNRSLLTGTDGNAYTAPTASFPSNTYGLFDMGGNVWQWSEDWYRRDMTSPELRSRIRSLDDDGGGQTYKAARGASFYDSMQMALLTSTHDRPLPTLRQTNYGFRCVLVVNP